MLLEMLHIQAQLIVRGQHPADPRIDVQVSSLASQEWSSISTSKCTRRAEYLEAECAHQNMLKSWQTPLTLLGTFFCKAAKHLSQLYSGFFCGSQTS